MKIRQREVMRGRLGSEVGLPAARAVLRARLEERRPEIEQLFLTRIYAIADPTSVPDPQYLDGLRSTVAAALDFALAAIEEPEERRTPIPVTLLAQARLAARNGIGLDTVLRRYCSGYALLMDLLIDEVDGDQSLGGVGLKSQLRDGAGIFDRLIAAISEEYVREGSRRPASSEQLRAEQVAGLLNGELLDASALNYDFDARHLGLVVSGEQAREILGQIASGLDCRLLVVNRPGGVVWAWLGRRGHIDETQLRTRLASTPKQGFAAALGESAERISGWRLSHRQAAAAFPVAARHDNDSAVVRYADVALLAAAMQDDLLDVSLRQLYIAPLESMRDGGKAVRETLRAYFDAGRNVTSTAAALGISRQTVNSRLRSIEKRIARPIATCVGELETAVRMEELSGAASTQARG